MIRVRFRRSADACSTLSARSRSGLPFSGIVAPRSWQTGWVSELRQRLSAARLYLVCDAQSDDFVGAAVRGGVDVVQLRCKDAADGDVLAAAERFAAVCREHGALFIVNDRPDLAAACGADGVHVGQDDVSPADARAVVGEDRIVGLSTHSPAQVDAAASAGVDYIGVGPVHATPTKPGRSAVGLALVSYAAAHATLPWFAIGGINPGNIAAVVAAGAERVVVVRALTQSSNPELTASVLRNALHHGEDRVGTT